MVMARAISALPSISVVASAATSAGVTFVASPTSSALSPTSSAALSPNSSALSPSRKDKALFGAGLNLGVVVSPGERKHKRSCIQAYADVAQPWSARDSVNVTLYDLLGISKHVTLKEIKTAYREKARQLHPDVNPPSEEEECTRKFLEVQKAYGVLVNPNLRARYDYTIRYDLSTRASRYGIDNGAESFGRVAQPRWKGEAETASSRVAVDCSSVRMPSYSPKCGESRFRCSYEMAC